MDSPAVTRSSDLVFERRWFRVALLTLSLVLYGWLLAENEGAYAAGSDSSGYLNNTRLLRQGRVSLERRTLEGLAAETAPPLTYVPLGFAPVANDSMVPTYPIGLSLLILGVSKIVGWGLAPHVTLWLHAMAGVCLMYALSRLVGLAWYVALLGAVILGLSPVYLFMGLQAMSDVPALVWCTAAVYCAWASRKKAGWAIVAGLATAVAVLLRPTNILIIAPVAVCLGRPSRRWLWLILGGLPGAVVLAVFNFKLYGKILTTGYGDVGSAFGWAFVVPALQNYLRWLPVLLTPGLLLLAWVPWAMGRTRPWLLTVIALWIATNVGFYTFYFHTHEWWWYLRFILPSFPPAILGMLIVFEGWSARWSHVVRGIVAAVLLGGVVAWDAHWVSHFAILDAGRGEKVYPETARWVRDHLPANAIVVAMQTTGALQYHTDFTFVRWDQFSPSLNDRLSTVSQQTGRPIYAVLFPFERQEALEKKLPGQWTQVGAVRQVTIWRRDGREPTPIPVSPWHELISTEIGKHTLSLQTTAGWYDAETNRSHLWSWSSGTSRLSLILSAPDNLQVALEFKLRSLTPRRVTIRRSGQIVWEGNAGPEHASVRLIVALTQGTAVLDFSSDSAEVAEDDIPSSRKLSFAIEDPILLESSTHP